MNSYNQNMTKWPVPAVKSSTDSKNCSFKSEAIKKKLDKNINKSEIEKSVFM